MLKESDNKQLQTIGKTLETAEREISLIHKGVSPITLTKFCGYGDGITALDCGQKEYFAERFKEAMAKGRAVKFVAASGAASRMFQDPIICLQRGWVLADLLTEKAGQGDENARNCLKIFRNLDKFPFFPELKILLASKKLSLENLLKSGDYGAVLENILSDQGLGFRGLPKGLMPFHSYPEETRTAFEEHLIEGIEYLKCAEDIVRIHFTITPDYIRPVKRHVLAATAKPSLKSLNFDIGFSHQKGSTDTVVLDDNGQPLRDSHGNLVLRPSGHGALLENLNALKGDIIFIKTIDNVLQDRFKELVCFYKRVLGGYLVDLQGELFHWLRFLSSADVRELELKQIEEFALAKMNLRFPPGFGDMPIRERSRELFQRLNAPVRVCGMVQNSGYPGGKPFWVRDLSGWESVQIVEPGQIDRESDEQQHIWNSCEFFNPVDIVCGVRDYVGKAFDLSRFGDPDSGFVSDKSHNGRRCRVLERPGLWNGSMARWNTVFIEVPAQTLRPVKTILDLLESC